MSKDDVLRLLRDIADDEGGDVSLRRFLALSGIKEKQIIGVYWPTWNVAKQEAGLGTKSFVRPRINVEVVVPAFAALLVQLDKWPTESELRLAKRTDERIPSVQIAQRFASNREFLTKLRAYCETNSELAAVVNLIADKIRSVSRPATIQVMTSGYVYMMRSGRRYKIGHTSSPSRRHREVRLDLPERTDLVHSIATDDPTGIEAYWHDRFAVKRIRDTEFFELSAQDIAAFKKRKFQ
jgi:hypothetical protein